MNWKIVHNGNLVDRVENEEYVDIDMWLEHNGILMDDDGYLYNDDCSDLNDEIGCQCHIEDIDCIAETVKKAVIVENKIKGYKTVYEIVNVPGDYTIEDYKRDCESNMNEIEYNQLFENKELIVTLENITEE